MTIYLSSTGGYTMLDPIHHPPLRLCTCVIVCLVSVATPLGRAAPAKVPVLLDTDVGGDIDDALALALALSSPEIDLQGITTVDGDAHTRALILCRLLHAIGKADLPLASAAP